VGVANLSIHSLYYADRRSVFDLRKKKVQPKKKVLKGLLITHMAAEGPWVQTSATIKDPEER
jgi:hypothetical protein